MAAMCLPEEAVIGIGRRIKIDDDDMADSYFERAAQPNRPSSALLCILSLTWTKPLRMSEGLRPAWLRFWPASGRKERLGTVREREQGERIVPGAVQRLSPSRPSLIFRTEQQRRLNCRTTVLTSHASAALLSQSRSHRWSRDSRVEV